jgi:triosephosphate isomerase
MTNKYKYFIANWKMYGNYNSIKSLNRVVIFLNKFKQTNFKIIYCPPYTLLKGFLDKLKNSRIDVGGQNCHYEESSGPFTGSISAKMLKEIGCKYVIIGHSENRNNGETNLLINKKIKSALRKKLKVIFCIGENSIEKKRKITKKVLARQIKIGLNKIKTNDIIVAYEPVWSIGTGLIQRPQELDNNVNFIKHIIKKYLKKTSPKVLYGGSVGPNNINIFKNINSIDGFLVGGASQKSNKFIDIIKKTYT